MFDARNVMIATPLNMTCSHWRLVFLIALIACSPSGRDRADTAVVARDTARDSAAVDTAPRQWVVRADGIGPLQVGVPLAAASRAVG